MFERYLKTPATEAVPTKNHFSCCVKILYCFSADTVGSCISAFSSICVVPCAEDCCETIRLLAAVAVSCLLAESKAEPDFDMNTTRVDGAVFSLMRGPYPAFTSRGCIYMFEHVAVWVQPSDSSI